MKTNNRISRMVRGSILALSLAAVTLATLILPAGAQSQMVGDDGIAASPKVRAQIEERKARLNVGAPVATRAMGCAKCQDQYTSIPVKGIKGAQLLVAGGVPTQKVAKHLCAGCETTVAVAGTGKAKQEVVIHKCSSCGSENLACCSTKASAVATQGMEKKSIEIAPIK